MYSDEILKVGYQNKLFQFIFSQVKLSITFSCGDEMHHKKISRRYELQILNSVINLVTKHFLIEKHCLHGQETTDRDVLNKIGILFVRST